VGQAARDQINCDLPKMLLIDDEPINIEVMSAMLETHGHSSEIASTSKAALALVERRFELVKMGQAKMYSIIFLDYSMPDMDGPQVARSIRDFLKQSQSYKFMDREPYIVCCTAYSEATFMRQAFIAGMNKFLTKPVSDQELKECLEVQA